LNVSVVSDKPHAQPKLLNYITAPDVVISSAVIASSAIPGLLPPAQLLRKDENGSLTPFRGAGKFWRDGSLRTDIPERELTQLFNVQYTIVSQMNPHIVLFFYNAKGSSGSPSLHRYGKGYRGGFINSSLVHHFLLDLQKWLALLRDMDLFPRILGADFSNVWLQKFEGSVTILPPPLGLEDFRTILSDPSVERLQHQIDKGQLQTWPKLRNIENRMRIEQSLTYWRQHLNSLSHTPLTPESSNEVMSR
jgi:predicted acylesterase/phospholipase RssA